MGPIYISLLFLFHYFVLVSLGCMKLCFRCRVHCAAICGTTRVGGTTASVTAAGPERGEGLGW